jgi:hypothetical protein
MSAARSRRGSHRAPRSLLSVLLPHLLAVLAVVLVVLIVLVVRGQSPGGGGPAVTLGSPSTPSATPSPTATVVPSSTSAASPAPSTSATSAPAPTSAAAAEVPAAAPDRAGTPVLVLNNSRITGLAADAAADLRRGGWLVAGTGNFAGRLSATTVFYTPGNAAEQRAAQALAAQFPRIAAVAARFPGLPGSGVTLVVTRYWAG